MKELIYIQENLKAPKNQRNSFGNYNYRSAEDILEAVKPLLTEQLCTLTISDEMVECGGRIYVKATTTLTTPSGTVQTSAFAREEETKKGMDGSQITGSASSYARKYALNGLFCIDDTKDSDATNTHGKEVPKKTEQKPIAWKVEATLLAVEKAKTTSELMGYWQVCGQQANNDVAKAFTEKRKQIEGK